MVVNMVARSKFLQEVVYTHIREDVLEDAMAILRMPWEALRGTRHEVDAQFSFAMLERSI